MKIIFLVRYQIDKLAPKLMKCTGQEKLIMHSGWRSVESLLFHLQVSCFPFWSRGSQGSEPVFLFNLSKSHGWVQSFLLLDPVLEMVRLFSDDKHYFPAFFFWNEWLSPLVVPSALLGLPVDSSLFHLYQWVACLMLYLVFYITAYVNNFGIQMFKKNKCSSLVTTYSDN